MSIVPEKHDLQALFSKSSPYLIDFYQRDYKWRREHILKLIEDLFYRFDMDYDEDHDATLTTVNGYGWYYLNTYVTNGYQGRTYLVDGQQRLTTLTLMLIKLYHRIAAARWEDLRNYVRARIVGDTMTGPEFWMAHPDRRDALEDLFRHDASHVTPGSSASLTVQNLYRNYDILAREIDGHLLNEHRLKCFTYYLMSRVMLVQIEIQETEDVPMVFEVINDRGERLRPYEVLKGKLLGQIPKSEVDDYHDMWQSSIHQLQEWGDDEAVDDFFRTYFRAKFVQNRNEYREFDGDYHKTIFENKWQRVLGLKHAPHTVKEFVRDELQYYSALYVKVERESRSSSSAYGPYLHYNWVNGQDRQTLLILAACLRRDAYEGEKIELISRLFDRHFSVLQLSGAYDSNRFNETLVTLNNDIRNLSANEIAPVYERYVLSDLGAAKGTKVTEPLQWSYFQDRGKLNLPYRFVRYFFARVEHLLSQEIEKPTESFYDLVRNSGPVHGYNVEHILTNMDENRALFVDEDQFQTERNRLGALLLLTGPENLASNAEDYEGKLKTYVGSLLWNQTLCADFYHSNTRLRDFNVNYSVGLRPLPKFEGPEIGDRQKVLFTLAKLIWA